MMMYANLSNMTIMQDKLLKADGALEKLAALAREFDAKTIDLLVHSALGLAPATLHKAVVRARNALGDGKYSSRVEAETPSGGAPKMLGFGLKERPD